MATSEHPAAAVGGLSSWRDGPAKQAIVTFVERVCGDEGSAPVPVEDRVAVFDNDGTLWCEKPMPIQLDFILRRLAAMAEADTVENFEAQADDFLRSAPHPTLGRGYLDCAYAPMVELLGYLAANGFSNYIVSGGGRDFFV